MPPSRPGRICRLGRWLLVPLLALGLGGGQLAAAPDTGEARQLIESVGDQVLDILQAEQSQEQKFDALVDVLGRYVDIDLIARLILGRHWRTADADQQEDYLQLFEAYALDSLASRLNIYQGQRFEVTGAQPAGKRDVLVTTRILSGERPPLAVDWRLREQEAGLIAIDVIVEGVSLIVTQRSEFASVIERRGMDGLLDELRRRIGSSGNA